MNAIGIIEKKRDRIALSKEEIAFFVNGYVDNSIPDYQAAAFCMATFLNGMTHEEIVNYTMALAHSGDVLDLSDTLDFVLDKHSSGGVGDKTTLVVLPLVVACGVPVAKMSGRGLSFTGGTLDKFESISGFNVNLSIEQIKKQVTDIGIVLAGQTSDLAPADGRFYALRDVTATVPSIPLIAGSIMSKKIAGGAQGLLLDVKCGRGAFMKDPQSARSLADIMIDIGESVGIKTDALISDMNQPLGEAVGNAVEVIEAIETLHGRGPEDFVQHCLRAAARMLAIAGKGSEPELEISATLKDKLSDGSAWNVFRKLIIAQGGDVRQIDDPSLLPSAPYQKEVLSDDFGYIESLDAQEIGLTSVALGAGRYRKGDPIDHGVGILVHKKVGDRVEKGEPVFTILSKDRESYEIARQSLKKTFIVSTEPVSKLPLFYD